jgi:hypothetical protein
MKTGIQRVSGIVALIGFAGLLLGVFMNVTPKLEMAFNRLMLVTLIVTLCCGVTWLILKVRG